MLNFNLAANVNVNLNRLVFAGFGQELQGVTGELVVKIFQGNPEITGTLPIDTPLSVLNLDEDGFTGTLPSVLTTGSTTLNTATVDNNELVLELADPIWKSDLSAYWLELRTTRDLVAVYQMSDAEIDGRKLVLPVESENDSWILRFYTGEPNLFDQFRVQPARDGGERGGFTIRRTANHQFTSTPGR